MFTTVIVLVIAYIIVKSLRKANSVKRSDDAVRADLSIIELNAANLRHDLYEKGGASYDDIQRVYQIETLARGLNEKIATSVTARTK